MTEMFMSFLLVVTIFKMVSWVIPAECFVAFVAAGLIFSASGLYFKANYDLFTEKVSISVSGAKRPSAKSEARKWAERPPYSYNIITGQAAAGWTKTPGDRHR